MRLRRSQHEMWSQVLHQMIDHSSAEPFERVVNLTVEWEVHSTSSQENPIEIGGHPRVATDQLSEMKA